jgi:hypothetical protein
MVGAACRELWCCSPSWDDPLMYNNIILLPPATRHAPAAAAAVVAAAAAVATAAWLQLWAMMCGGGVKGVLCEEEGESSQPWCPLPLPHTTHMLTCPPLPLGTLW